MTIFTIIKDESLILEIINWTVPFLLGLFSSFFIDKLRNIQKRKRNKKFILMYLEKTILADLSELELAYLKVKNKISNYSPDSFKISVFESFNTNVLNGIESVEYYEIFENKFTLLNEIITMIDFLSQNLPIKINNDFYDYLNNHLKEKNLIGDFEHVQTCQTCISRQSHDVGVLEMRIEEIQSLQKKIKTMIE